MIAPPAPVGPIRLRPTPPPMGISAPQPARWAVPELATKARAPVPAFGMTAGVAVLRPGRTGRAPALRGTRRRSVGPAGRTALLQPMGPATRIPPESARMTAPVRPRPGPGAATGVPPADHRSAADPIVVARAAEAVHPPAAAAAEGAPATAPHPAGAPAMPAEVAAVPVVAPGAPPVCPVATRAGRRVSGLLRRVRREAALGSTAEPACPASAGPRSALQASCSWRARGFQGWLPPCLLPPGPHWLPPGGQRSAPSPARRPDRSPAPARRPAPRSSWRSC